MPPGLGRVLALVLTLAAVGASGAGCGGGGTDETSEAGGLADAVARYTGLPSADADAIAGTLRGAPAEALGAVAETVDAQPPLPDGASLAAELETMGEKRGFDGASALRDLCEAILDAPSPRPRIQLEPATGALEVRWLDESPTLQLGRTIHRAAVTILERTFEGGAYSASFLEGFEDMLVDETTRGVAAGSDRHELLLWLRIEQLRSGACS
jgi:hypothetical protein